MRIVIIMHTVCIMRTHSDCHDCAHTVIAMHITTGKTNTSWGLLWYRSKRDLYQSNPQLVFVLPVHITMYLTGNQMASAGLRRRPLTEELVPRDRVPARAALELVATHSGLGQGRRGVVGVELVVQRVAAVTQDEGQATTTPRLAPRLAPPPLALALGRHRLLLLLLLTLPPGGHPWPLISRSVRLSEATDRSDAYTFGYWSF